jgi:hypothetical protein
MQAREPSVGCRSRRGIRNEEFGKNCNGIIPRFQQLNSIELLPLKIRTETSIYIITSIIFCPFVGLILVYTKGL